MKLTATVETVEEDSGAPCRKVVINIDLAGIDWLIQNAIARAKITLNKACEEMVSFLIENLPPEKEKRGWVDLMETYLKHHLMEAER